MRSALLFVSYIACALGAVLLAIGGFYYIGGNSGPTIVYTITGAALFCGGIIGGMKLNS